MRSLHAGLMPEPVPAPGTEPIQAAPLPSSIGFVDPGLLDCLEHALTRALRRIIEPRQT